jgi:hypothetical protein
MWSAGMTDQRSDRQGRRGVATHRLEDNGGRANRHFAQLFGRDEPVLFIGHNDRWLPEETPGEPRTVKPKRGGLQHRPFTPKR